MDEKRFKELVEKVEAGAREVETLANKISELNFKILEILKNQKQAPKKKPDGEKSLGAMVWDAYEKSFLERYHHKPVRNARVNAQCADIAKRLGADGPKVAEFYLSLKDPQFLRLNHPIGHLQMSAESVHSMWKRGGMTTGSQARTIEKAASNISASQSYLERKHGKT